jgi:uncharacterized membrane-anchored protein
MKPLELTVPPNKAPDVTIPFWTVKVAGSVKEGSGGFIFVQVPEYVPS